jgi:BirA family biotin operon repressor/biotin-[acetyl-CoA-carboxylase] ligase
MLPTLSDWPGGAVDLAAATNGTPPPRATLTVALIEALAALFAGYSADGFRAYREDWRAADYLYGRPVRIDEASGALLGTALGIEADGALLIETTAGTRRRVIAGDVSVRGA